MPKFSYAYYGRLKVNISILRKFFEKLKNQNGNCVGIYKKVFSGISVSD